jgi:GT2 family glycosyltransferase
MSICTVVIVSYNSARLLPTCLKSILNSQFSEIGQSVQIIVYDNASPQGGVVEVQEAFPEVEWHFSDKNIGFGCACNAAAKFIRNDLCFFINPDVMVYPNTLQTMIDFYRKKEKIGILGGRVLNADGTLQKACRRTFPSASMALFKSAGLSDLFPKSRVFSKYNLGHISDLSSHEVDAVSGSFFLISTSLYEKLAGFDEDFFMYGEDLDLCRRVQKQGLQNYYFADAVVTHFKGQSSKTLFWKSLSHFYRAMIIFAQKHRESSQYIPISFLKVGIYLVMGCHAVLNLCKASGVKKVPFLTVLGAGFISFWNWPWAIFIVFAMLILKVVHVFTNQFGKSKKKVLLVSQCPKIEIGLLEARFPSVDILGHLGTKSIGWDSDLHFSVGAFEESADLIRKMKIKELWLVANEGGTWYNQEVLAILMGLYLPIRIFMPILWVKNMNFKCENEFLSLYWQSEKRKINDNT